MVNSNFGVDTWYEIEKWKEAIKKRLKQFLNLDNGIPFIKNQ